MSREFFRGVVVYGSILSLYQDIRFGTAEAFAEYVLHGGWIDRGITIPIAALFLVAALVAPKEDSHE